MPASRAGVALPSHTELFAGADPRRDLHRDLFPVPNVKTDFSPFLGSGLRDLKRCSGIRRDLSLHFFFGAVALAASAKQVPQDVFKTPHAAAKMNGGSSPAALAASERAQDLIKIKPLGPLPAGGWSAFDGKSAFFVKIVVFALFRVTQDIIRLGDLFELFFGGFVAGVGVGVKFLC